MEEMLEEVEAMAQQQAENDANALRQASNNNNSAQLEQRQEQEQELEEKADNSNADTKDSSRGVDVQDIDDFDDDIPSPPQISSDLNGSRVDVPEIPPIPLQSEQPSITAATGAAATAVTAEIVAVGGNRPANPARRTFGGSRNVLHMDLEEMDNENMTIGHMSPLANRGRQTMLARDNNRQIATTVAAAAGLASTSAEQASSASVASVSSAVLAVPAVPAAGSSRFHALGSMVDADDPFGPTPERNPRTAAFSSGERYRSAEAARAGPGAGAMSAQSNARSEGDFPPHSTRSWDIGSHHHLRAASAALGSEATATYDEQLLTGDPGGQNDESGLTIEQFDSGFTQASIDGTTSILPTREMLQQAARVAEGSAAPALELSDIEDDIDVDNQTRNSVMLTDTQSHTGPLVAEFSLDLFPPAFRSEPASLQLRELYDLVRSQDQRIWSLDDLIAEVANRQGEGELRGLGTSVYVVLLDLLSRRRLIRNVSDNLWSAQ
ncbi:hypothetical protein J3B02_001989 [Coemansia erecta]|nr:hypothetical protein J3B02_001989 [Coemansia erecta]KAJ2886812.1 hypothetical protein FB639_001500 [Coemansia asiatica]